MYHLGIIGEYVWSDTHLQQTTELLNKINQYDELNRFDYILHHCFGEFTHDQIVNNLNKVITQAQTDEAFATKNKSFIDLFKVILDSHPKELAGLTNENAAERIFDYVSKGNTFAVVGAGVFKGVVDSLGSKGVNFCMNKYTNTNSLTIDNIDKTQPMNFGDGYMISINSLYYLMFFDVSSPLLAAGVYAVDNSSKSST